MERMLAVLVTMVAALAVAPAAGSQTSWPPRSEDPSLLDFEGYQAYRQPGIPCEVQFADGSRRDLWLLVTSDSSERTATADYLVGLEFPHAHGRVARGRIQVLKATVAGEVTHHDPDRDPSGYTVPFEATTERRGPGDRLVCSWTEYGGPSYRVEYVQVGRLPRPTCASLQHEQERAICPAWMRRGVPYRSASR